MQIASESLKPHNQLVDCRVVLKQYNEFDRKVKALNTEKEHVPVQYSGRISQKRDANSKCTIERARKADTYSEWIGQWNLMSVLPASPMPWRLALGKRGQSLDTDRYFCW